MTLTEVVVTIGIAGTLMAIAVPDYRGMKLRAVADRQCKETRGMFSELQAEAMFRKRTVRIAVTPDSIKAVSIPDMGASTAPSYAALDVNHPNLPGPPTPPTPAPGDPAPETPKYFAYNLPFPGNDYVALYMDTRGYIYRLNEDNSQNFEPVTICFATPNKDALVVYTTGARGGRLTSGTACELANIELR